MTFKNHLLEPAAVARPAVAERDYWMKKLSGNPEKTTFPTDANINGNIRAEASQSLTAKITFAFSWEQENRLMKLRNGSDPRLHIILTAVLLTLLKKYTGNSDIIIASPIFKQDVETKFLNTVLVLRNLVDHHMTFKELLIRVRETIIEAVDHVNYPLQAMLHDLDFPADAGDCHLFDMALMLENIHNKEYIRHVKLNILFSFRREGNRVKGTLEYNALLYRRSTVKRIVSHFKQLTHQALLNVETPLWQICMLSRQEKNHLLLEFNNTGSNPYSQHIHKTLHGLIEEETEKTPNSIAVIGPAASGSITYGELNRRANQLAVILRKEQVRANTPVGLLVERSLEMIIGLLGIMKAGGAYLPLDPQYPAGRIKYILEESSVKILVIHRNAEVVELPPGIKQVEINPRLSAGEAASNPAAAPGPTEAAYVIYTSGTSGWPKGVVVEHRNIVNTLECRKEAYRMNSGHKALQLFPYSFDGFLTSFFTPVISGAPVVLTGKDEIKDIGKIKKAIVIHSITHFICVPALYQAIIDSLTPWEASTLMVVTLAGDILHPTLLEMTRKKNKGIEVTHEYGVTEAAVMSTLYRHQEKEKEIIIGHPLGNTEIYLLDAQDQPVPIGAFGEICIGGDGVARGYINRPGLTAEKFVPNPFVPGKILYRTGDLARWTPGGTLQFSGRRDHQVKIRGIRIELQEIENQLMDYPPIKEAVVSVHQDSNTGKRLTAYVVPDPRYAPVVCQWIKMEKNGLLAGQALYQLPNGMNVFYLSRSETDMMYKENSQRLEDMKQYITLRRCDCIFDVGANTGIFSLLLHRLYHDVTVYAFEPIPPIYQLLELNTTLHGMNTRNFKYGVSRENRQAEFTYYPNASLFSMNSDYAGEEKKIMKTIIKNQLLEESGRRRLLQGQVNELLEERLSERLFTGETKNLSQIIRENGIEEIGLLKIDIGKGEEDILMGIHPEDWPKIQQLAVEIHDIDNRLKRVIHHLEGKGYRVTAKQNTHLTGIDIYDVYAVTTREYSQDSLSVPPMHPVKEEPAPGRADHASWNNPGRFVHDLKKYLRARIPDYMMPSRFELLEILPLTPNGKIDRKALPTPRDVGAGEEYIPPGTELEKTITGIWRKILKKERISIHDNIFDIGGNSLDIIKAVSKMKKALDRDIPILTMYRYPTISAFSGYLHQQEQGQKGTNINTKRLEAIDKARVSRKNQKRRRK